MAKRFLLLLFFTFLLNTTAFAGAVTCTLQNAHFSDGGIATGYFIFDSTTNTILSYKITVSGGDTTKFPAFTY